MSIDKRFEFFEKYMHQYQNTNVTSKFIYAVLRDYFGIKNYDYNVYDVFDIMDKLNITVDAVDEFMHDHELVYREIIGRVRRRKILKEEGVKQGWNKLMVDSENRTFDDFLKHYRNDG
jgi:hypothetical protein